MSAPAASSRLPRGLTFTLVFASILNPLNTSTIAPALGSLAEDLAVNPGQLGWLVAVVMVVSAITQPLTGLLCNRIDPRIVFVSGLGLVALSGVVGSLAHSFTGLVLSRALTGAGTAAVMPACLVLLRSRAEELGSQPPTQQLAWMAAGGNVMAAAGLPLGGGLVTLFGWRSVFALNTPAALLALALGWFFIGYRPRPTRPAGSARGTKQPWTALGTPAVLRVYARSFALSLSVYLALYSVAQWLDLRHGFGAGLVGLALLPQSGLAAAAALRTGRSSHTAALVRRPGFLLLAAALALGGAAFSGSPAWALATSACIGLAFGIGMVGNQAALYEATPTQAFGFAAGLWKTMSYLGGFASMQIMNQVFARGVTDAGLWAFAGVFALSGLVTLSLPAPAANPARREG